MGIPGGWGAPRGSSNGRRAFWTQQASLGPKLPSLGRFLEGISSWAGSRPGTQVYPSRGAAGARAQSAAGEPQGEAGDPAPLRPAPTPGVCPRASGRGSRASRTCAGRGGLTVGGGGRARLATRGSSGPGASPPATSAPQGGPSGGDRAPSRARLQPEPRP